MASSSWALTQIARILPLDEQSLQEILDYSSTLSKDASAEHLRNLLGTSPKALEFITSFNSRRDAPKLDSQASTPEAPEPSRRPKKRKQPLNKPFNPRQPEDHGNVAGGYQKQNEADYMAGKAKQSKDLALANTLSLSDKPDAPQLPIPASVAATSSPKKPPSATGPLISDLPNLRTKSHTTSRTSSPAPKAKVNVPGGASMHGASTTLQDLDSAIRTLELQTNPSLSDDSAISRACPCNATRHPLLAAAPNCLNCGKIICVKEGIGPCTSCSKPLLSPTEINAIIRSLREERGRERMSANNASHKRADLASTPRPFTPSTSVAANGASSSADPSLAAAQQHRDKLLTYQSQNARRTHIIDEAADFETPVSGQNIWASPAERAMQLKRQQKVLREQEWNARPEWEKKKVVVSIDLKGGKAVRKMGVIERPADKEEAAGETVEDVAESREGEKRAFGRNPLMGGLIRPVWKGKGEDQENGMEDERERQRSKWRRVQDDEDDNEAWILDGGVYGDHDDIERRRLGAEEHAFG
ncbi:MAG: hypothetical protein LQ352_005673 [Teloschistes flavicans]|nr:MAG: hypothetical protein LQ352_005673 [Teloschistes flavicans]